MKKSLSERIFDSFNIIFMCLVGIISIYPFWYVLITSLSKGEELTLGPVWLLPRGFTFVSYHYLLQNPMIKDAFIVTIGRAALGSTFSILVTFLAAFALSKRDLPGRKAILYFMLMPSFIGGTVVSYYVVMAKLGLTNKFLVYIIPSAFGFFSMVIMRTFIEQIPEALEESAKIDGAGYLTVFIKVIIPLSKPIIAAMLFFSVVGNWLDFSTNLLYVTDRKLFVLQYVLYKIVVANESSQLQSLMKTGGQLMSLSATSTPTPEVLKMAILVIVTFPLLFIYPFFQKYFIQGMMVGAIKA